MPCVFSMFNFNPVASENLCMISKARQTEGLPTSVRVKSLAQLGHLTFRLRG